MSELSKGEQARLREGGEQEELARLNREYEERFGGLRYVYVSSSFFRSAFSVLLWMTADVTL